MAFQAMRPPNAVTNVANPGWQPNNLDSNAPSTFLYTPEAWEPPTSTGAPNETVSGFYRWTRMGFRGVGFGGTEPHGSAI
jgi:hypothetical protein